MNAAERRMEIFNRLQKSGGADLNELSSLFHVSTMTIRRDLHLFEHQGVVTINYGKVYLNKDTVHEPSFTVKSRHLIRQKAQIACEAAEFIREGDTVIIDCGTTTLQLLKYLVNKRITIITNSWPVINYISGNPKIKLVLLPGVYDEISAGAFGDMTVEYLKMIHADKAFMGSHGCDLEAGATVPEPGDATVKRALLAAGKKKYLLADATKFGQVYLMQHAALKDFDCVITDSSLDPEYQEQLRQTCRRVIFAGGKEAGESQ